ncbi:MAG: ABC transporter permease [Bdellovibrionales bacterium]|nr:ABC transporter permease [Bdellovibrionales bacterium]
MSTGSTSAVIQSPSVSPSVPRKKPQSLWGDAIKRLKKNKAAVVSAYFVLLVCLVAIFAEQLAPYPFDIQDMSKILQGPTAENWLGTDSLGRDLFSRIIFGARMSMAVGIFTAVISLVIGVFVGAVAGWFGGKMDAVLMRFVDILYSVPTLVLLILVKVIFDSVQMFENPELKALTGITLALSVVGWVTLARVVRGQVLQVREMTYVEAARALGASGPWIVIRHVIPNIMGPIIVLLTYQIPSNILFESFLSFIGLGLQPPFSSWGVLANEGWRSLRTYPHLMIWPGVALFLAMLAFQLFGDGLRDAFDPQMKGKT